MYAVAALCVSCYLAGMNDFIRMWIGEQFVIEGGFIYSLAFNRFIFCAIHPLWIVRESSGLFVATKYVMLMAALLNIVLSVLLSKFIGISGILLATSLSYLLTIWWYEPWLLAKKVFQVSVLAYWKYIGKLLGACVLPLIVGIFLLHWKSCHVVELLRKFMICGLLTIISFSLYFKNTSQWNYISKIIFK